MKFLIFFLLLTTEVFAESITYTLTAGTYGRLYDNTPSFYHEPQSWDGTGWAIWDTDTNVIKWFAVSNFGIPVPASEPAYFNSELTQYGANKLATNPFDGSAPAASEDPGELAPTFVAGGHFVPLRYMYNYSHVFAPDLSTVIIRMYYSVDDPNGFVEWGNELHLTNPVRTPEPASALLLLASVPLIRRRLR